MHGKEGLQLSDSSLPPAVVSAAFQYSLTHDVPLCAFLGDDTATLRMTPELQLLTDKYYEPVPHVHRSLEELLRVINGC